MNKGKDLMKLLLIVATIFWLVQLIDLLRRDVRHFENYTHKLVWFVVLCVGYVLGAIWYMVWGKQAAAAIDAGEQMQKTVQTLASIDEAHGRTEPSASGAG